MGIRLRAIAVVVLTASVLVAPTPDALALSRPSAPRSVSGFPGFTSIKVTWQRPASTGGARIDRYKVVRWGPGLAKKGVLVGPRKRSLRITGLRQGTRYSFFVRAHNSQGWGPASRTVRVRTMHGDPPPPPPPTSRFGTIAGPCGSVAAELDDATASLHTNRFDFHDDPYDDPADRPLLTLGAQTILVEPNAGGSSAYSEAFAFETLARCEGASLVKTETEIVYDTAGAHTDLSVQIGASKVGVSVARAVTFPPDTPLTPEVASGILTAKLADITESSQNVSAADAWVKQILVVMAYSDAHADAITSAWNALDATTKGDTIAYVVVTDGSDTNLYFD